MNARYHDMMHEGPMPSRMLQSIHDGPVCDALDQTEASLEKAESRELALIEEITDAEAMGREISCRLEARLESLRTRIAFLRLQVASLEEQLGGEDDA